MRCRVSCVMCEVFVHVLFQGFIQVRCRVACVMCDLVVDVLFQGTWTRMLLPCVCLPRNMLDVLGKGIAMIWLIFLLILLCLIVWCASVGGRYVLAGAHWQTPEMASKFRSRFGRSALEASQGGRQVVRFYRGDGHGQHVTNTIKYTDSCRSIRGGW